MKDIIEFLDKIQPLILIIIPTIFGIYLKLQQKLKDKHIEIIKSINNKNRQTYLDYKHEESIKVVLKLKEVCNYYCDIIGNVHTSYIQIENGTVATSKLCNMFFSCIAEDDRYKGKVIRQSEHIQRMPFVKLSCWFNRLYKSKYKIEHFSCTSDDIDKTLGFNTDIKYIISSFVRDLNGNITGVCNFIYSEDQIFSDKEKEKIEDQMLCFVSSIETIFLSYNINLKLKRDKLGLKDEEN